jgi:hypothetical protein
VARDCVIGQESVQQTNLPSQYGQRDKRRLERSGTQMNIVEQSLDVLGHHLGIQVQRVAI